MVKLKKNIKKFLINFGLLLFSSFLSYKLSYFIGENYFFDKFFYKKSIKYGYGEINKNFNLKNYGKRSKDLLILENLAKNNIFEQDEIDKVLGIKNDNIYRIAVIGDSVVWGVGLKNKERFVEILEKKLNKIYPTKVFSFSYSGDSIVDNYIKYILLKNFNYKIDLYIFGLVSNDLKFSNKARYDLSIFNKVTNDCSNKDFYYWNLDDDENLSYLLTTKKSFSDDFGNFCVLEKIADLLPKKRAIYFDFSIDYGDKYLDIYRNILKGKGLFIKKYIDESCDCERCNCYYVSEKERHPSAFANKKYAEFLYNEITTNSEYGFIEKITER